MLSPLDDLQPSAADGTLARQLTSNPNPYLYPYPYPYPYP